MPLHELAVTPGRRQRRGIAAWRSTPPPRHRWRACGCTIPAAAARSNSECSARRTSLPSTHADAAFSEQISCTAHLHGARLARPGRRTRGTTSSAHRHEYAEAQFRLLASQLRDQLRPRAALARRRLPRRHRRADRDRRRHPTAPDGAGGPGTCTRRRRRRNRRLHREPVAAVSARRLFLARGRARRRRRRVSDLGFVADRPDIRVARRRQLPAVRHRTATPAVGRRRKSPTTRRLPGTRSAGFRRQGTEYLRYEDDIAVVGPDGNRPCTVRLEDVNEGYSHGSFIFLGPGFTPGSPSSGSGGSPGGPDGAK